MSKAGAPKGNQNAAKGARLKHLLTKRLEQKNEAEAIINALVEKAKDGDLMAINQIFDRTEGKPKQAVDIGGGESPIEVIERRIVSEKVTKDQ